MDTSQIMRKAARRLDISEDDAWLYFDTFFDVISGELRKGNDVSLTEFGEFYLEVRNAAPRGADGKPAGMRRAVRKVVFRPGRKLEDAVNRW